MTPAYRSQTDGASGIAISTAICSGTGATDTERPMTVRAPKKSETLEIRLPYESKVAFMAKCRAEGLTASEVLRGAIEAHDPRPLVPVTRGWSSWLQVLAVAGTGALIGAVAVPSIAQALPQRPAFERLDVDHNGVLTPAEFRRR